MSDEREKESRRPGASNRRMFLKAAMAGGLAAGTGSALAQDKAAPATLAKSNPRNLPPRVPRWSKVLGDGVEAKPYGTPSKFEAHVVRRDVEWLTASR
ncbi:MAG TPA: sulfite dehydrogenase, partial [Hyphomicrobiaceae bacterium]|nr:sulfite dehydrogenase [Hyphomicrobiaceae bacterium]